MILREAQQSQRDGEGGKRERERERREKSCFERASACEDIDVASVEQLRKFWESVIVDKEACSN